MSITPQNKTNNRHVKDKHNTVYNAFKYSSNVHTKNEHNT